MTVKIAINGLGRIGRSVLRAAFENNHNQIDIVKINGPANIEDHAHFIKYDSIHGTFPGHINVSDNSLIINNKKIQVSHERDLNNLDWNGIDIVFECTGNFNNKSDSSIHLTKGAKKVLVSAPCKNADSTIVYGVNNDSLNKKDQIISIGSCTTNCLAPVAKIINDNIGIESGFMTTIHSYTNDQRVLDGSHKDLRRARACALSMIPTSTGAAKALGLVLPELDGKLDGSAVRVPTPNVSMIDLSFISTKSTSTEEINNLFKEAAANSLQGILDVACTELVSVDFNHSPFSSIVDPFETKVIKDKFCRIVAWYDNEWGFSNRMLDVAKFIYNNLG